MYSLDNEYARLKRSRRNEVMVAYEDGWPVCVGTPRVISEFWGVSENTVLFMTCPCKGSRYKSKSVERTGQYEQ